MTEIGGFFHGNGWDLKDRDWSFRGVQSPACFMGKNMEKPMKNP
jgi:hypothetical protein